MSLCFQVHDKFEPDAAQGSFKLPDLWKGTSPGLIRSSDKNSVMIGGCGAKRCKKVLGKLTKS